MRMHPVVAAGLGLLAALFVGSWLYDYFARTAQVHAITIVAKQHRPGHYEQECTSREEQRRPRCEQVWKPPAWLVRYGDAAGSHDIEVSSEAYDALRSGDGKWISYQRGAVWGTRYDERILSQPPDAERAR